MSGYTISKTDFERFREFFYRKTGIWFDDSKRYFVDRRLEDRIEATGCRSFNEYFFALRLRRNDAEIETLINSMTVNETYFFREDYQLKCLVSSVLPELTRKKDAASTIRIWSIPSSTGEEPYSIALYLLEFWPGMREWNVELVASDVNTDVIQKAKEGIYSQRSVSHLPRHILNKYFSRRQDGTYQLSDAIRKSVRFTHVNIVDPEQTRSYRNFDVIFCRNMLIYFDDLSRRQAAEALFDALTDGGFVFLGHSESMSRISSLFRVRRFPEAIVYQKPEAA